MAKVRRSYVCNACGAVSPRWMGKCPDCGAWDALEEVRGVGGDDSAQRDPQRGLAEDWAFLAAGAATSASVEGDDAVGLPTTLEPPRALLIDEIPPLEVPRLPTAIGEFDRVLGGGLVPGSTVLVGGEPGIGKSTLMLQAAARLASPKRPVLYISSEESAQQVQMRAQRLALVGARNSHGLEGHAPGSRQHGLEHHTPGSRQHGLEDHTPGSRQHGLEAHAPKEGADASPGLYILADTNLARLFEQARRLRPAVLIVDSIQMIYHAGLDAAPGSIAQLRRCCMELVYLARTAGVAVILVGHVTKEGQVAGPRLLEHLVDAVIYFEGDRYHAHRVVRAVKNRFGTTLEIGLFEMSEKGLREVSDPSGILTEAGGMQSAARPGSVVTPAMQGSRCFLVEVQALTSPSIPGAAKRRVSGLDANRFTMILAVLEKHGGLRLGDQDVFASIVGGLRIVEPATDLALALAIAGTHLNRALGGATIALGEIGLGGEVRRVGQIEQRLREAARLGFRRALVPPAGRIDIAGIEVVEVATVQRALSELAKPR